VIARVFGLVIRIGTFTTKIFLLTALVSPTAFIDFFLSCVVSLACSVGVIFERNAR